MNTLYTLYTYGSDMKEKEKVGARDAVNVRLRGRRRSGTLEEGGDSLKMPNAWVPGPVLPMMASFHSVSREIPICLICCPTLEWVSDCEMNNSCKEKQNMPVPVEFQLLRDCGTFYFHPSPTCAGT